MANGFKMFLQKFMWKRKEGHENIINIFWRVDMANGFKMFLQKFIWKRKEGHENIIYIRLEG